MSPLHHAVRARLDIMSEEINKMAKGKHISADMKINNGYIILSFKGAMLGLGLLIDGKVSSQMPRRTWCHFWNEVIKCETVLISNRIRFPQEVLS